MKTILCLLFTSFSLTLAAQKPVLVIPTGHAKGVFDFCASPDGQFYLTTGYGDIAILWDADGRELHQITLPGKHWRGQFSADSRQVALASRDGVKAVLLDIQTLSITPLVNSDQKPKSGYRNFNEIRALEWIPNSQNLILLRQRGELEIWPVKPPQDYKPNVLPSGASDFSFSEDGKTLATLDTIGLIRIWGGKQNTFELKNEFRIQIPPNKDPDQKQWHNENLQLTPDGKAVLAPAGKEAVHLYNTQTGALLQQWEGFNGLISSDGKYYCILHPYNEARVYSVDSLGAQPCRVFRPNFTGYDGPLPTGVVNAAFCPDNQNIIVWGTGNYEKWHIPRGKGSGTMFISRAAAVGSAVFSPQGDRCAISSGKLAHQLYFSPGRPMQTLSGHQDEVTAVQYTPDGQKIVSSATDFTSKLWDAASSKQLVSYQCSEMAYPVPAYPMNQAVSPDGKTLYKLGPELTAYSLESKADSILLTQERDVTTDLLEVSGDGKWAAFETEDNLEIIDLQHPDAAPRDVPASFAIYKILPDGKTLIGDYNLLKGREDQVIGLWDMQTLREIKYIGHNDLPQPIASCQAMDVSSDGKMVAMGDWSRNLVLLSLPDLKPIHYLNGHVSAINSVHFSKDGRFLLSTSQDNTTRIWEVSTGRELAQIILLGQKDWAVVSPNGMFDASPGGMNYLYFVIGNEALELEQLKERNYEPGLLSKILGFSDEARRSEATFADPLLFPKVNARIHLDTLHIELQKRNGGIGKVVLIINDRPVEEDINPQRLENLDIDLSKYADWFELDSSNNHVALIAYNAEGRLKSRIITLPYNPNGAKGSGSSGSVDPKPAGPPALYALCIGTSNYTGEKLDLRYPDKDAAAMAEAIRSAGTELFVKNIQVRLLQSKSATPEGISSKANINAVLQAIADTAKPKDILLIYFSGHGVNYGPAESSQFYYLTKDIASEDLSDPEIRNNFAISSNELTNWIRKIKARKRVMIFDACNSGKVVEDFANIEQKDLSPDQIRAFDRMKDRTGMFILTGSAADKVSYEASQYGQGLLTYSLLEGMSGPAFNVGTRVDVMQLFQYSRDRVPELAKGIGGIQVPMLSFPVNGASFDIGVLNANVKIPVAQVKPVFARNLFSDENTFDDGLGLNQALADYFKGMTAKGSQEEVVYVDANNFENAWSLKGRYTVEGDVVKVTGRLFRGKAMQGEFKAEGNKNDMNGLVENILDQVWPKIK